MVPRRGRKRGASTAGTDQLLFSFRRQILNWPSLFLVFPIPIATLFSVAKWGSVGIRYGNGHEPGCLARNPQESALAHASW